MLPCRLLLCRLLPCHRPIACALRRGVRTLALVAMMAACGAAGVGAVTFIEQAQRLERINAALLDLRPGAPPYVPDSNDHPLELGLELIPMPAIDNQVGAKKEPIHAPPAIPRARLRFDHALGEVAGANGVSVMAGGTYGPPVPVMGYTSTWLGGEGALTVRVKAILLSLRGYALSGSVNGPITGTHSDDAFTFATSGADVRLGIALGDWRAYGGYGAGHLETLLTVGADGARIRDQGAYRYALAGAAYQWERWRFTFEQQSTEDYLRHVILGVSWRY
jgi:hypothetical protein